MTDSASPAAGPDSKVRPVRFAVTALIVLVAMTLAWIGGARAKPSSVPPTRLAHAVVLFGIPQLGVADLRSTNMPNLQRLISKGALAAMTPHTLRYRANSPDAYATISAGSPVRAVSGADDAYDSNDPLEGATAAQVAERRSGIKPHGQVVDVDSSIEIASAGSDLSSEPGDLGKALALGHKKTAVINNADKRDPNGLPVISRPAALATMDRTGSTDFGEVDGSLLEADPNAPFGIRANPAKYLAEFKRVIGEAQFVVIDPGDTDRVLAYTGEASSSQAGVLRQQALHDTDELLGQVAAALPKDDLLLVAGVSPPAGGPALTPLVAYGAGVIHGHLVSDSTKRADLVTLTDLSPTILDAMGVKIPPGMIGQPLRYKAGTVNQAALIRADAAASAREAVYSQMSRTFITLQAVAFGAIVLLLMAGATQLTRRRTKVARVVALTFAAWPLATFLLRLVPSIASNADLAHVTVWLASLAMAALAEVRVHHPLDSLARISGVTVVILAVDLALGGYLESSTVLGYSPYAAARFTGIGNASYSVLGAAAIIWAVVHVDRAALKGPALLDAAGFLLVVAFVDGAPALGSDVGGILSLIPVFSLLLWLLSGRRITWKVLVAVAGATVAAVGLATLVDILRPAADRTHLAHFVDSSGASSGILDTITRKISTNLQVLTGTVWMWMVPISAAYGTALLLIDRAGRIPAIVPKGSAARCGLYGLVGLAILGSGVNDSGIVIAGTVAVFVGPYLTLLATASAIQPDDPAAHPTLESPPATTPEIRIPTPA